MHSEPIEASGDPWLKAVRRRNLALAVESGIALAHGWPLDKKLSDWLSGQGFDVCTSGDLNSFEKHQERMESYTARMVAEASQFAASAQSTQSAAPVAAGNQLQLWRQDE